MKKSVTFQNQTTKNGCDRMVALQSSSERLFRRANTLNLTESLRLDRHIQKLSYRVQIDETHNIAIQEKLRKQLEDHELYKKALVHIVSLQNNKESDSNTLPPLYGRYNGRCYNTTAYERDMVVKRIEFKKKQQIEKLLEKSRLNSDALIKRSLPTDYLLQHSNKSLYQRFNGVSFAKQIGNIQHKSKAISMFSKMHFKVKERNEIRIAPSVQKTSKGVFQTSSSAPSTIQKTSKGVFQTYSSAPSTVQKTSKGVFQTCSSAPSTVQKTSKGVFQTCSSAPSTVQKTSKGVFQTSSSV
ncbi:uncharacterized protein [Antedon mediterranea]|uniref:uncharacterized protein n=1 Tax=Antedon mediterranea TaxID=105859 RepID=UPI003AF67CF2